ncbi:MAG: hypothetical protein RIQ52_35 [Pseudomonadota bacterium]|jgi:hydroxymethylbilane synthase
MNLAPSRIRIATRRSPLAMWQAEHVASLLKAAHPGLEVDLLPMVTQGDRILDAPLAKIGGKGLFVKELEQGLLSGIADIAVHSMKDVPVELPEGLHLGAILRREDPRDALVSVHYDSLDALPANARIGTSSLRRECQLKSRFPGFQIQGLRGNVNTRLARLDQDEFDAILLASAGLIRLGMADRIRESITPDISLPAIGQGIIGIECRKDDTAVMSLIQALHDQDAANVLEAERAMNERLQGGCQIPIAGHAELLPTQQMRMRGLVGSVDGTTILYAEKTGPVSTAHALGIAVADELLAQGAGPLLLQLQQP